MGDDPGLTPVRQPVRDRYLEVNGEHPMTEVDDTCVQAGFTPATAMADLAFGHVGVHRLYADLDTRNERSPALADEWTARRTT